MITCPNCNGNLKFDISLQKLHCSFCDASYDPYAFDEKKEDGTEKEVYEAKIFTCPECAGEIESTDVDVTGFCPFCGASTIFYSRLTENLKPDYIIPFAKTKEDCKRLYMEKARKALFLPKEYKDAKYIDGFRGIYMPYWSYDITQIGDFVLQGEKTHRSGDYIIHDHFDLKGNMDTYYRGLSYDASSSFSDDISAKIAPFNIKEKVKFTAGFLSGFYADTADVEDYVYKPDAEKFAIEESLRQVKGVPQYGGVSFKDNSKQRFNTRTEHVDRTMYPVWFMSYRHNDRVAYATVNGQTGKVSADFPIDVKKYILFSILLSVILFIALNMFFTLKPSTTSMLTAILGLLSAIMYLFERKDIEDRNTNAKDKGYLFGKSADNKKNVDDIRQEAEEKSEVKRLIPKNNTESIIILVLSMTGTIIPGICWLSGSIHDWLHYTVSMLASIFIAVSMIFLIKNYNFVSTRPLPQFKKKGGDDRA